ncbi:hypothetical protein [Paenibacillus odorifer]|uniref:hypothetical protein n=1 Tax=Paenibacillus odorifer TaxID=189426 RepID=UPI00096CD27C|nr:hypothetical protein [Paenibacillus odorifer]OMD16261.1 hypothetical protein BJP50_18665 [Paenibacillus odorifer]
MSSACQCHVENAFCFYCEVYSPVVAENERLKAEGKALTLGLDSASWDNVGYTEENDRLLEALHEIDTHIRGTSEPIPHIVATLKRVLPEYGEGSGDPFADEEVTAYGNV